MDREGVDQLSFKETQADLEDGQIPAVFAINEVSATFVDGARTGRNCPDIQQDDRQGQARQPIRVVQHGAFQVKTVSFQIAKHLFDSLLANDKKVREGLQDGWRSHNEFQRSHLR